MEKDHQKLYDEYLEKYYNFNKLLEESTEEINYYNKLEEKITQIDNNLDNNDISNILLNRLNDAYSLFIKISLIEKNKIIANTIDQIDNIADIDKKIELINICQKKLQELYEDTKKATKEYKVYLAIVKGLNKDFIDEQIINAIDQKIEDIITIDYLDILNDPNQYKQKIDEYQENTVLSKENDKKYLIYLTSIKTSLYDRLKNIMQKEIITKPKEENEINNNLKSQIIELVETVKKIDLLPKKIEEKYQKIDELDYMDLYSLYKDLEEFYNSKFVEAKLKR